GVAIVRTICKFFPDWLRESPMVLDHLQGTDAENLLAKYVNARVTGHADTEARRSLRWVPVSAFAANAATASGNLPQRIWLSKERIARLQKEEELELEHLLESKKLVKCLLCYARCNTNDHEVLFNMLTIFTVRSVVDYSFLKQFYAHEVNPKP
ncbi:hypothetical protein T484DRAFT_1760327, partial [Baffinella frigidus]